MIDLDEVQNMLGRFNDADEMGELTEEGIGARKALMWVLEEDDYSEMDGLLPEIPVCEDCGDENCSGAAGGECDVTEEDDEPEKDPNEFQIDLGLKGGNK